MCIERKADAILKRKAFIKKCLDADICPDCGAGLIYAGCEELMEMGCNACGKEIEVKTRKFFRTKITKQHIPKFWK